ncbi:MAG: DUF1295 domain-containing protein [Pseudomonadota bacterium]
MTDYLIVASLGMAGFLVLWPISLIRRDASIVDFWWGPGFAVMVATMWILSGASMDPHAQAIVALILVWGLRLGVVLGRRRIREGVEDGRYREMREFRGTSFWWKSLFMVFVLQGVLQVLLSLGALAAVRQPDAPVGPLMILGTMIALAGFTIEAISDRQLDKFRRDTPHGGLLTTGLRAIVRYPSYLGEVLFWWGIALIAVEIGVLWALLNAAAQTWILMRLSGVTILDRRLGETRPGHAEYRDRVPALVPNLRTRFLRGAAGPHGQ